MIPFDDSNNNHQIPFVDSNNNHRSLIPITTTDNNNAPTKTKTKTDCIVFATKTKRRIVFAVLLVESRPQRQRDPIRDHFIEQSNQFDSIEQSDQRDSVTNQDQDQGFLFVKDFQTKTKTKRRMKHRTVSCGRPNRFRRATDPIP